MGKPRFIAASFSGKLKKEERRVRTENTEGTECTLGTPIFRLAWLLGDKRWVRTENTENTEKDENVEDMPD